MRMSLKQKIQERIEKDAVVSEINGRKVVLKESAGIFEIFPKEIKDKFKEWKEINPIINEDGRVNYINLIFGGWRNLITLLIILFIVGMYLMQYFQALHLITELQDNCVKYMMNSK
ncbi:MAG: hypothetical protein ACOC56_03260 [Atribacterota bacterium]